MFRRAAIKMADYASLIRPTRFQTARSVERMIGIIA
jgi:hypothetical protein